MTCFTVVLAVLVALKGLEVLKAAEVLKAHKTHLRLQH
jgi:hypothetical protein